MINHAIAVIPARGGSKRIPRKNIKDFCGKPMIAWSIEAAKASGLFEHIIVSTDDAEIAAVAKQWGAEVPFVRPAELSNDHAGTTEVIAHATQWALDQDFNVKAVCCIYATAPFVQVDDLKRGLEALESGDWAYAFTVTNYAAPIFRSFKRTAEGGIEMFFPEHFSTRSQDLPAALHDAGQFYWGRPSAWLEGKDAFGPQSFPVIIPHWRIQDIDSPDDWHRAEILAPAIMGNNSCVSV
jgi:N-acylneuraminate cytidylyltransferase